MVVVRIKFRDHETRVTTVVEIHKDSSGNVSVEYDGYKYEGYYNIDSAKQDAMDSFPGEMYAMTSIQNYS